MKLAVSALRGKLNIHLVGVAQLVRAPGCGPGGRGFETPRPPQFGCRHRVIGAGRAVLFRELHRLSPSVETRNAPLAQLVEQRTLNPQVLGSIPRGRTKHRSLHGNS